MKKIVIIYILLIITGSKIIAQQLPHFRNSHINHIYWNPAYIVNPETPNAILNHRAQWVGFSGAPKISILTGKYNFREDMAAGVYMINDITGISRKMEFCLNYAYLLKADKFNISFGLAWTITQFNIIGTNISLFDVNDQAVNMHLDDKTWKPDANAGIIFYSEIFYIGFAINQLLQSKYIFFNENDVPGTIESKRHYLLTGAYNFSNNKYRLSPFINNYYTPNTPYKFDIGLKYFNMKRFFSSLVYSSKDAIVFSAGYKYEKFFFEYSFDIITSRIRNVSSGAHEISVGIFLSEEIRKGDTRPMF